MCYCLQMEFELPLRLKQVLLSDYDSIARHEQLRTLPCKPCVADILSQYVEQSNSEGLAFEAEVTASPCATSYVSYIRMSLELHIEVQSMQLPHCPVCRLQMVCRHTLIEP